jgi:hypothetical protein
MSAATERGEIGPLSMQPCETARCFAFREKSVSSSSLARDFREADGGPEPFSMVLNHITSGLKAWSNKRTVELSLQIANCTDFGCDTFPRRVPRCSRSYDRVIPWSIT